MDFDVNDPLGDLLSDDSNDSFFDDNFKNSSKTKPQNTSSVKKSSLFGLEEQTKQNTEQLNDVNSTSKVRSNEDWLGLNISNNATPVVEKKNVEIKSVISNIQKSPSKNTNIQKTVKQSSFKDDLDFLDDIGLSDDKLSLETSKKSNKAIKTSLDLDELLGKSQNQIKPNESTKVNLTGYTPTIAKNIQLKKDGTTDTVPNVESKIKPVSKMFEMNQPSVSTQSNIRVEKKDIPTVIPRRQKNQDWLGLLSDTNDDVLGNNNDAKETLTDILNRNETKANVLNKNTPVEIVEANQPEGVIQQKENPSNSTKHKERDENEIITSIKKSKESKTIFDKIDTTPVLTDLMNNSILGLSSNIDIEQQSAAICLQQQESHLMVALQMKAQEERLAAMHERQEESRRIQHEVVSAHREQLDNILKGQTEHRTQLQNIILEHQQRINKHIERILRPPVSSEGKEFNEEIQKNAKYFKNENNQYEVLIPNKKQQLEEMISIIKENYEKEIELMENSYRRQIVHVNESLQNLEEMYRRENEKLSQYYMDKIELLEKDKIKITEYYENNIKVFIEKQTHERERMEKKHLEDIEILQRQHSTMIKNIGDTIELEKQTMKSTTDYSQKLEILVNEVQNNNKLCQDAVKRIEDTTQREFKERDETLKIKEDHLKRMLEIIEKQSKSYEIEVSETKTTLQLFEQRLSQQNQMIEEERQKLKQKELVLNREKEELKLTYDQLQQKHAHEKELFKKTVTEFEKSNSDAKLDIEERLNQLEIESNVVKNEKRTLQELKNDLQMLKLKVEDETKELNENKAKLRTEHDKLYQREYEILEKSKDLDMLTRNALAKHKNAETRSSEAIFTQQRYEEKLNRLQEQCLSLNAREQQLAREKVALSRERLMLYNQQTENQFFTCNVCRTPVIPQKLMNNRYEENLIQEENIDVRHSWLENKTDNVDLKDIKESLNNIDVKNNQIGNDLNNITFHGENGYKDHIPIKFQDMVDPQLMALKFDIFKTKNFL